MLRVTSLVWLLYAGTSMSVPTDELTGFEGGGIFNHHGDLLMSIIPGYTAKGERNGNLHDLLQYNEYYKIFNTYMNKGTTVKGLTFNIYNEDMKEAASALFEIIHSAEVAGYNGKNLLYFDNLNEDLVTYAFHLNMLYRDKRLGEAVFLPPFIIKPNYFVNGETIIKALKLCNTMNDTTVEEALVGQYYKTHDTIIINSNYSGWNVPQNGGEEELNYFREDISLNSYYYGVHLMHPYWMFDHKLYSINHRHEEHYYYTHQQLVARLLLEKEHLIQDNATRKKNNDYGAFNPYLIYENGLPFPTRSNTLGIWSDERAKISAIDIAIKECMSRKMIMMDNTDYIKLTESNYVYLLTKLVRANFEVGRIAKMVRSLFGYGANGYPYNEYNPAPSLLHHPQTTLRDPIYWYMMQYVLNYFIEYKETIEEVYFRQFSTKRYEIIDANIPKITTYFGYYQFNINRAVGIKDSVQETMPLTISARQKRLKHSDFEFSFTVDVFSATDGIVRLFLGPRCELASRCWKEYSKFYELDKFFYSFDEGKNNVTWSPGKSNRLSNDEYYNIEGSSPQTDRKNKYNMFKFPENLIIPRGLEKGLNLTLFIIITPPDNMKEDFIPVNNLYADIYQELDSKPLGFPFDRPAVAYDDDAPNYKFYNITIYHKQNNVPKKGYFSPHLQ